MEKEVSLGGLLLFDSQRCDFVRIIVKFQYKLSLGSSGDMAGD